MDERFLVRVPESLGVLGVLMEPMAVAVKGVQKLQNGTPISDCSVFGTGKLGCMVLLALRALGETIELRGYDRGKGHIKQRFVEAVGARYIDVLEEPVPKDEAEVIIETAGDPGLIPDIIAHAKPANGRIVLMGYCEDQGNVQIPPDLWVKLAKDLEIVGSTNFNRFHMEEGGRYLQKAFEQYHEALSMYITAKVPYKEYKRAFELAQDPEHLKVVLEF
jgi:threonine dehydrogenase-like Zn-dependent dehydrogenase